MVTLEYVRMREGKLGIFSVMHVKFAIPVDLNKRIKQINLLVSLHTSASFSELLSNTNTMAH